VTPACAAGVIPLAVSDSSWYPPANVSATTMAAIANDFDIDASL
jgi:hypothetical protein